MNCDGWAPVIRPSAGTPTVQFLGHAGFLLEFGGRKLLCDPWMSETGAFLHSWHQFPPNGCIDRQKLYDADYLYVSHPHEDHFDREFLASFPKERVVVLIADFITDSFANEFTKLGFRNVVKLRDWQRYSLAQDFTVELVRDQSLYKLDSALIADVAGQTVVDQNDCHLTDAALNRIRERPVALYLGQFSGAMWFPAAYDYSPPRRAEIAAGIRSRLLQRFIRTANILNAGNIVHCAGPPCFLEDDLFHLNVGNDTIFPDQADVLDDLVEGLEGSVHLVHPGDLVAIRPDGSVDISSPNPFDFSRKSEALVEYQKERLRCLSTFNRALSPARPSLLRDFADHLNVLVSASPSLAGTVCAVVRFNLIGQNGGVVRLDGRSGAVVSIGETPAANYTFSLPARLAQLVADGELHWEELLLSMRVSLSRDPDEYNWPLFAILRYGYEPALLNQIEMTAEDQLRETIRVRDSVNTYRIQKYCPHAGEDLSGVEVRDGQLVCPRHGWTFDLTNGGQCVSGGNLPLKTYHDDDDESEGQA